MVVMGKASVIEMEGLYLIHFVNINVTALSQMGQSNPDRLLGGTCKGDCAWKWNH